MKNMLFNLSSLLGARTGVRLLMGCGALLLLLPVAALFGADSAAATSPLALGPALVGLCTLLLALQLRYTVVSPMEDALRIAEQLSRAPDRHALGSAGADEGRRLLAALDTVQRGAVLEREQERTELSETRRISDALLGASTNVMIADAQLNIVYANKSVLATLTAAEADLRQDLPQFSVDKVVGSNIDIFHKNPQHQRHMLEHLSKPHSARLKIGPRHLTLVVSPVIDSQGERAGFIVEWRDITAETLVENEVVGVVAAAANGDFSKRLPLEGKSGFALGLAQAVNNLIEASASGFEDVKRVISAVASGDLTQTIEKTYHGTLGELMGDVNASVRALSRLVAEIRGMSQGVGQAAREISMGNADLSTRTEQQAASIEETASSMEELTGTVRQNAENARQANQLVIGASDVARSGGEVVRRVVVTMDEISTSSRKIADIIGVIDGIAFQTNILALNAAVEAARAGEQGRGFAVVASEVRSLAQRSAAAAKEIKDLIQDSSQRVGQGAALVQQAGKTMEDIVQSVQRVTDIMAEISAASAEQSAGIEQVATTVTHMDQTTQQNAALVEQASASARSLDEQATALLASVERFKVDSGQPGASRPVSAPKLTVAASTPATPAAVARGTRPAPPQPKRPAAARPAGGGAESADSWSEF